MDFGKQVAAFRKKALENVDRTMRGVSIKLFSAVIKSSPVDSGRFRANWQASGISAKLGQVEMFDKSGAKTTADVIEYIRTASTADNFTLSNNLPYSEDIEYGGFKGSGPNTVGGFSKQAPSGVVRVNVARFQTLLDQAARENK